MIVRELAYSGKQYKDKQVCIQAFDMLTANLSITALHTHYTQGESLPEAWLSLDKLSVSFKLQFLSLEDQLSFIGSIHTKRPVTIYERFLSAIQKELKEILGL